MTIKKKFTMLAWIAGGVLLGVMLISFMTNRFLINANNDIYRESTKGIEDISAVQHLLNDARGREILAVSYAAVANIDMLADLEKQMKQQKGRIIERLTEVRIEEKTRDVIKGKIERYFEASAVTFEHARRYVTDEAARNITENSRMPFEEVDKLFSAYMDEKVKTALAQNKKAGVYATISMILIVGAAISAAGLVVFLLYLSRSIVEPVNTMVGFVKKISEGDLNSIIKIDSKDEIGVMGRALMDMSSYLRDMASAAEEIAEGDLRSDVDPKSERDVLGSSFKKMILGLRNLITEIRAGANMLASASTQIASSAVQSSKNSESSASAVEEITATIHEMSANMQNVAANTQKQTSSVAETSSSVEQMMTSIVRVAENVKKLVSIAEASKKAVSEGSEAVDRASRGMNMINESIKKSSETITSLGGKTDDMAKIVEVIDDIAEQTNLLALNAAIEAAKAGDQGLGFAVVADEVRKLAERSAQSTREIAELIRSIAKEAADSVDNMTKSASMVEQGLHYSNEVIKALDGIRAAVDNVTRYSGEIGAATEEQAGGSDQIRKAVVNINEVIHEISAASEQQSIGAEQVVQTIERVKDMVQQNSSGAIELASSADHLSKQAVSLQGLVERFTLNGAEKRPVLLKAA